MLWHLPMDAKAAMIHPVIRPREPAKRSRTAATALTSLGLSIVLLLAPDHPVRAEAEDRGFEYGEIEGIFDDPLEKEGYLDFGPLDPVFDDYFRWKDRLGTEYGLSFMIEDRLINQWGDDASIYDNEINLIGRWDFLESELGSTSFNVWGQFAQSIGGKTAGKFQADTGVLSPLNGGNGGPGNTNEILQMLTLEQVAPGGDFRFQIGKLALRTLVDLNRYANGDSEMFFSPMIGNNTVVPETALLGLGVFGQWKEEDWYLSGLVRAPDTELGLSFDAVGDGNFAYVGEAALTPTISGLGYGEYRVTVSYNDANAISPSDIFTVSTSFDQDIGDDYGAFFKFSHGRDTFRDFENRIAGGMQIKKPFGFAHDRIGLGAWWGDPTNGALNDEVGLEVYYKAQVKRFFEITPDFQLVIDPARSNDDLEAIVGLRLRAVL